MPKKTGLKKPGVFSGKAEQIREAIRGESLDGWLFCNFRHRDLLSDELLGLSSNSGNSRLWIYLVPAAGKPRKIIHNVEPLALASLPGDESFYTGRRELASILGEFGGKSWGVQLSESLPAISFLDAGTAAFFKKAGLKLVSAAGLIQRFKGLLDEKTMASHERAALGLYRTVEAVWEKTKLFYNSGKTISESGLADAILSGLEKRGLVTDHGPIVAAGANAGNPHYGFTGKGKIIRKGDIIQFDLWAKENKPCSVYADISWVGFFGCNVPPVFEKNFADLVSAREGALAFIEKQFAAGLRPEGAAVDKITRRILIKKGYEKNLKHRTGHGIDTEVHGSGVNIDSVEFPDRRLLLDGSCFSLEPGVYFEDRGFRTEIDVYIRKGKPIVSGGPCGRQFKILVCR